MTSTGLFAGMFTLCVFLWARVFWNWMIRTDHDPR